MYKKQRGKALNAYGVVRYFEKRLNEAGNPIKFTPESSEGKQLGHAKRLLKACQHSAPEVRAIIDEYCRDAWLVENRPALWSVVDKLDEIRAKLKMAQQVEAEFSWEDLA
jgi:hypothetical protein